MSIFDFCDLCKENPSSSHVAGRFTSTNFCEKCHDERYEEAMELFSKKCQEVLEKLCQEWGITVEEYRARREKKPSRTPIWNEVNGSIDQMESVFKQIGTSYNDGYYHVGNWQFRRNESTGNWQMRRYTSSPDSDWQRVADFGHALDSIYDIGLGVGMKTAKQQIRELLEIE